MQPDPILKRGFTLIEMTVVLIIIGLVVSGILMGQHLMSSAAARAQITQIDMFQSAKNAFKTKFGALPGDMPARLATRFGFAARGQYAGEGDGNGLIEGISANATASNAGYYESAGETSMFWADLLQAGQIGGSFPYASETNVGSPGWIGYPISAAFPAARIGGAGYVYVFSSGGLNFFGVSSVPQMATSATYGAPNMTVAQAYAIDTKIDDGMPESGNVLAGYVGQWGFGWDVDLGIHGIINDGFVPYYNSTLPSSTSCVDNGGAASAAPHYSMSYNNGAGLNCGLSFQFQ